LNGKAYSALLPGKHLGKCVGKKPKRGGVFYLIRNKPYSLPQLDPSPPQKKEKKEVLSI